MFTSAFFFSMQQAVSVLVAVSVSVSVSVSLCVHLRILTSKQQTLQTNMRGARISITSWRGKKILLLKTKKWQAAIKEPKQLPSMGAAVGESGAGPGESAQGKPKAASSGLDLMADLKARLNRRRTGIGGGAVNVCVGGGWMPACVRACVYVHVGRGRDRQRCGGSV
jgi:hypothetical protein